MSHYSNGLNGNSLDSSLLEIWFNRCTELNDHENLEKQHLEKLVEDLTKDELVNLIYQILEDANYHDQVNTIGLLSLIKY